ncbi:energy transducer TonB [Maridesulfovibrio bastinii]|uniref:energy transducer TonB n=1 Tax=Maridesulfovibrio bastinii TaxID=47157 RepID=UPI0004040CD2|nr:energy transducer TonB [Maridesulfovibrio bastinii]
MIHRSRGTGDLIIASLLAVMITGLVYVGVVMLNTGERQELKPVVEGAIRIAQAQDDEPVEPLEHKKLEDTKPPEKIKKTFSSRTSRHKSVKPRISLNTPEFSADMYPGMGGDMSIPRMNLGGMGFELDEVDEMPQVIRNFPPKYPFGAKRKHVEGQVVVRMLVNSKGIPTNLSINSSTPPGIFEQAALNAAKRWKFKPGRYNGKNVDTWVLLPFKFELTK